VINLSILDVGVGRCAVSRKEAEVPGMLVKFEGDPGPAFISFKAFEGQINYRFLMQQQVQGPARSPARRDGEAVDA
jgi:hypothetical protein